MRSMKWIGIVAAITLIISCFMTWVVVQSKNITVSGVDATGTNFGKPGYFHLIMVAFFLVFSLLPRAWAKRANLLVAALNMAWAIRNYFLVTTCRGGDCPEKHIAIYLILFTSLLMLAASMFPDLKQTQKGRQPEELI